MLKSGKKNIGANIRELKADNMKKVKEKGAGGKVRPMKQIIAISLNVAKVPKKKEEMKEDMKHEKKEMKSMMRKEKMKPMKKGKR